MGGMIAQALAIAHPEQVLSLCLIMSTTGASDVGTTRPEALEVLLAPAPTDRDGYIERQVAIQAVIGSPGFPTATNRTKRRAGLAFDRSFIPTGWFARCSPSCRLLTGQKLSATSRSRLSSSTAKMILYWT